MPFIFSPFILPIFLPFPLVFLLLSLFLLLYLQTLHIAFTLSCQGFSPALWMEQMLSQEVLHTDLKHPTCCMAESQLPVVSQDWWSTHCSSVVRPQRLPDTSVSVPNCDPARHKPGTPGCWCGVLVIKKHRNPQKCKYKVPLAAGEQTCVQIHQALHRLSAGMFLLCKEICIH